MTLTVSPPPRKSVLSLNELGQMNGKAGAGGGLSEDEEMPVPHEMGEELAFTGRYVPHSGGGRTPVQSTVLSRLSHPVLKIPEACEPISAKGA